MKDACLYGEYLMKLVSKFVLSFALGSVAMAPFFYSQAAYAQKEKKGKKEATTAPAAKQPVLSKAFTAAYAPAVNPFLKNDFVAAKAAWTGVKAAMKTDDEKYQAGVFAVQLAGKTSDKALLEEGYDLLIQSSFTAPAVRQDILFERAARSFDAKDFAAAAPKLIAAYDAGYRKAEIESLISSAFAQQQKFADAYSWAERGIEAKKSAAQAVPVPLLRQAAGYSTKLNNPVVTNKWMKELVKADGTPGNWRDMINLYMRGAGLSGPETLDMMRLMRGNNAIKYAVEYQIYGEALDPRRYPVEALAAFDEGIAAGNIKSTDASIKDYYAIAAQMAPEDLRGLPATEAGARSSGSGNVVALTADAFYSQKKFDVAKSLYELALTKGKITDKEGVDRTDRTIMRLGMVKVQQKDWAGAKAEFAKITGGKRKEMVEYWIMFIDQQMAKSGS
jgi:hypothetical protein